MFTGLVDRVPLSALSTNASSPTGKGFSGLSESIASLNTSSITAPIPIRSRPRRLSSHRVPVAFTPDRVSEAVATLVDPDSQWPKRRDVLLSLMATFSACQHAPLQRVQWQQLGAALALQVLDDRSAVSKTACEAVTACMRFSSQSEVAKACLPALIKQCTGVSIVAEAAHLSLIVALEEAPCVLPKLADLFSSGLHHKVRLAIAHATLAACKKRLPSGQESGSMSARSCTSSVRSVHVTVPAHISILKKLLNDPQAIIKQVAREIQAVLGGNHQNSSVVHERPAVDQTVSSPSEHEADHQITQSTQEPNTGDSPDLLLPENLFQPASTRHPLRASLVKETLEEDLRNSRDWWTTIDKGLEEEAVDVFPISDFPEEAVGVVVQKLVFKRPESVKKVDEDVQPDQEEQKVQSLGMIIPVTRSTERIPAEAPKMSCTWKFLCDLIPLFETDPVYSIRAAILALEIHPPSSNDQASSRRLLAAALHHKTWKFLLVLIKSCATADLVLEFGEVLISSATSGGLGISILERQYRRECLSVVAGLLPKSRLAAALKTCKDAELRLEISLRRKIKCKTGGERSWRSRRLAAELQKIV